MFNLQLNAYTTAISSVNKIVIKEWLRLNIFRFLMALKAASPQEGGIAILWEENHQEFEGEAMRILSPNLLTFQLITGGG